PMDATRPRRHGSRSAVDRRDDRRGWAASWEVRGCGWYSGAHCDAAPRHTDRGRAPGGLSRQRAEGHHWSHAARAWRAGPADGDRRQSRGHDALPEAPAHLVDVVLGGAGQRSGVLALDSGRRAHRRRDGGAKSGFAGDSRRPDSAAAERRRADPGWRREGWVRKGQLLRAAKSLQDSRPPQIADARVRIHSSRMSGCLTFCLAAALGVPAPSATYVGREGQLQVRVPRLEREAANARIDGILDEGAWAQAALLTGFSQFSPQDGIPSADSTEVLIWYSATALHVRIRAFEQDGQVHATMADRDKIGADDNVQLLIGTFHDRRQAFVFGVNPFGVQMDGTIVESGQSLGGGWTPTLSGRVAPDLSQDFVFTSKGHLTEDGYEVEIRIPFKSIKYQSADVQSWDINVVREVQHSGYEDTWAPARRSNASFLSQSGVIDSLSGFHRGLVLDVNPVVTRKATGAPS